MIKRRSIAEYDNKFAVVETDISKHQGFINADKMALIGPRSHYDIEETSENIIIGGAKVTKIIIYDKDVYSIFRGEPKEILRPKFEVEKFEEFQYATRYLNFNHTDHLTPYPGVIKRVTPKEIKLVDRYQKVTRIVINNKHQLTHKTNSELEYMDLISEGRILRAYKDLTFEERGKQK